MDSISSLLNGDLSVWGIIAMPIGVAICFGPALVAWLKAEVASEDDSKAAKPGSPDAPKH